MNKKCNHCQEEIPATININGEVKRTAPYRATCYNCRPFGREVNKRTPIDILKTVPDGYRYCLCCKNNKPINDFYLHSPKTGYRESVCKTCSALKEKERRDERKRKAIEYKGGKCALCGYDECVQALHFHHRDPDVKEFGIAKTSMKWEKIQEELDKCVLLCGNCHSEVHYGITKLPTHLKSREVLVNDLVTP